MGSSYSCNLLFKQGPKLRLTFSSRYHLQHTDPKMAELNLEREKKKQKQKQNNQNENTRNETITKKSASDGLAGRGKSGALSPTSDSPLLKLPNSFI